LEDFIVKNVSEYIGSPSQLYGIKDYRLIGSKADGMRAVDVYTSGGLGFTVLPDRGMDIYSLSFKGVNLSFVSSTGLTGSRYFQEDGARGFFRNFHVGFLTTCGLSYMGAPCNDQDELLGLHGVISNTPAYEVCPQIQSVGDKEYITVSGKVKEARMFGENLRLWRVVTCAVDGTSFVIDDTVQNFGFADVPFMLLYHCNFGYPMLDEGCRVVIPSTVTTARDADAEKGLREYAEISRPIMGYREQVFSHQLKRRKDGFATVGLINTRLALMETITYNSEVLPQLTQWKSMGCGEYVLGLEPGNCDVLGRAHARQNGTLRFLRPGETKQHRMTVEITEGSSAIEEKFREMDAELL